MHNSHTKPILKRIAGTLKYGCFDGDEMKRVIPAYIAFSLVCVFMGIGIEILLITGVIGSSNPDKGQDIFVIVGCIFFSVFLPLIIGILIYRNEKQKKEVVRWLDDAIELQAYSRGIDVIQSTLSINNLYKIQVEFKYDGKIYSYESRGKQFSAAKYTYGYHKVWKDYADIKVNILYSPTYKEVIVLKD